MNELPTTPTKPTLQTILITGSSGLIGSSFINRVVESYREMGFDPRRESPARSTSRCLCAALNGCCAGCATARAKKFTFSKHNARPGTARTGPAHQRGFAAGADADYPQSKVEPEQLILRERGDIPVMLLRLRVSFSNGLSASSAVEEAAAAEQ